MRKGAILAAALLLQAVVAARWAEAGVLINEVLADPAADANGDGTVSTTQDEFVELVNTGANPVSLADWTLADALNVRHVFTGDAVIPGYGFYVVFGGGTFSLTPAGVASTGGLSLNNAGDVVSLHDAASALADAYTYGTEGGKDVSLTRSPDATGAFTGHTAVSQLAFSPGATADGLVTWFTPPPQEPGGEDPSPVPDPEPFPDPLPEPGPGSNPVVPEPASLMLFGPGLLGLAAATRRRILV